MLSQSETLDECDDLLRVVGILDELLYTVNKKLFSQMIYMVITEVRKEH